MPSPNKELQKQAWLTAAKQFPILNFDLVQASESERLSEDRSKRIVSPFYGLNVSRVGFFVLMSLITDPSLRLSDLAKRWGVSKSAITRIAAPLEKYSYIVKNSDPADRRADVITLTKEGQEIFQLALNNYVRWLSETFVIPNKK